MQATYVGHYYYEWEMEGRKGETTQIHLVMPFSLSEAGAVGDKVVVEKVGSDLRPRLLEFTPGEPVEIEYGVGRGGKAAMISIDPVRAEPPQLDQLMEDTAPRVSKK